MYRPYLRRVEGGEMLIIVQTGKPIAEIKPVVGPPQGCARLDYAQESAQCLRTLDVLLPEDVIDTFKST
jgi:antitoxin (DNA-binding transcriptional repressor) of toxin-antitoxin stability system